MSRTKTTTKRNAEPREAEAPIGAMSIGQFARSHGISIDTYFRMARDGDGPKVMKAGARTLISVEAAEAWRRAREAAAQEQRRLLREEEEAAAEKLKRTGEVVVVKRGPGRPRKVQAAAAQPSTS